MQMQPTLRPFMPNMNSISHKLRFSLPVNCLGNTSERLAALLSELTEFLQHILFERCARSTQLWHKTVPTRAQLRRNAPRAHAEATAGTDRSEEHTSELQSLR